MIKKFIVPAFLLFSVISFAQQATSSPYSFYGIGDVKFKGTAENRAMGGLTIFSDSIHLNFQNPASYTSLKLTTFSLGGTYLTTKLKTSSQSENARRTAMDYLAVGLPFGKFGVGFGLMPYSSVGYNIQSRILGTTTPVVTPEQIKKYTGSGGLNKVFAGVGYEFSPKLSVGLDFSYNFGKIETYSLRFVDGLQYGSREKNLSDISGATFTVGATYKTKINSKLSGFGSLTFSPQTKLRSTNERNIATIQYSSSGAEILVDPLDINVDNTTIKMPSKVALGFGIGQNKKWMLGTEVTFQQSNGMGNRFNDINDVKFENAIKYTLGGFYIPNYTSFSKYLDKVTYRAGLRYENTGLIINNKAINDLGVTAGFGLPIIGAFSNINIGVEYGKRGTTSANLVQENYTNITIGLSLNDKWFQKKRFY
jgi:long-subunit fatty acid transport protein